MKDLIGATRELKGEVVKRKASSVPWDHVDEVRNAQGFLLNQIAAINRKLAHPGTDAAMRNLLVADLGAPAECWTSPSSSSPEPSEWSMTVAHDAYVRQLIDRAKGGTIPPQEVKQIAQAVTECPAGSELYPRLYAVARAGGPAYEPLIATYLIYPEDPEVSALAVQVLTAHWRVGAKYRKQILELLGSPEWDLHDDVFIAAVSGAGWILHDGFDAELLSTLLKLAEEGRGEYNDDLMQRLAVTAIARALGASHAELTRLPEGVTRAEWSQGVLRAARNRLHEAGHQP